MKNVLMILVFFGGLALNASAQANCNPANCKPANCTPCPPGCCIVNCSTSKNAAAKMNTEPTSEAQLASLMLGTPTCNMTKKEMKACIASCKANAASATTTTAHTTTTVSCKPSPTCQPTSACKSHQAVEATPAVYRASVQSKS